VVVSIDPRRVYVADPADTPRPTVRTERLGPNGERYCWWQCTVKGGREGRDIDAVELARAVQDLGAGEILLNCIDRDGRCGAGAAVCDPLTVYVRPAYCPVGRTLYKGRAAREKCCRGMRGTE
jgi:hypothetical protein